MQVTPWPRPKSWGWRPHRGADRTTNRRPPADANSVLPNALVSGRAAVPTRFGLEVAVQSPGHAPTIQAHAQHDQAEPEPAAQRCESLHYGRSGIGLPITASPQAAQWTLPCAFSSSPSGSSDGCANHLCRSAQRLRGGSSPIGARCTPPARRRTRRTRRRSRWVRD